MLKCFKITFLVIALTFVTPYLLGKLKFYGDLNAELPKVISTESATKNNLLPGTPVTYAPSVKKAAPAVVSIKTTQEIAIEVNPLMRDPFFRHYFGDLGQNFEQGPNQQEPPSELQQGLGSGVIIDAKGYILTNNHVIKDADNIVVALADGRSSEAKVVGSDPETDIAVLKIELDKLPVIEIGNSGELEVGDVVLAIGNPFGLDQTVTQGIISATKRTQMGLGLLENLLQTDAAINPGNSGGALVDVFGRLIGINTAIFTRSGGNQGIGFAIPIDLAKEVMEQLMSGKKIIRGWLGVQLQSLNKEIRENLDFKDKEGVFVRAVVHNSPAQKSGLLPGDIITKIDNVIVKDDIHAMSVVKRLPPNKAYSIEIFRKGEYMTFTVIIGERKELKANPPKRKKVSDQ